MTNNYFDSGDYAPVTRNTLARAEQVNDIASAVVAGFDLLPDPTALDQDRVTYAATVGGTANAITLTLPNTLASYTAGLSVSFKAAADNSDATTVNIDAVGAKAVKLPGGAALAGGEIQQDAIVTLSYNGTDFILTSGYLSTDTQTVAGIAADVTTVAGISGNVTTVAGISANVTTVAGISANVTTVAGISANVTTVAGISASVTTAAARDADIGTVAARDADIGIVADRDADIATVATRDADIATLADIEDGTTATGAIQTVAGIAANVTTVAGIAANVTTVAGVSANVTTVAGVAADVTTVAAIGGADISAVAAVDAEVATVAGVAANVTTVAGISANVTTVAGISANVTTVAGISADVTTAAANVADITNFADVYQGAAAANPTLRNDLSALQEGDLYFNTVYDEMRVYTGSAWITGTIGASVGDLTVTGDAVLEGDLTISGLTTIAQAGENAEGNAIDISGDVILQATGEPVQRHTLTGDVTYLVAGAPTPGHGWQVEVRPTQDATGGRAVTILPANLLTYSEQFDNAAWTKTRSSISADAVAAPDGRTTADKLIEDSSASSTHMVTRTPTLDASTIHTLSVYAKAAERTQICVQGRRKDNTFPAAYFNLSTGAVVSTAGSPTASGISDVGSGWYRCWITYDTLTGANTTDIYLLLAVAGAQSFSGDGASGAYLWGAQLVEGSDPLGYAAVGATRAGQVVWRNSADEIDFAAQAADTASRILISYGSDGEILVDDVSLS